jgi:hypothetical protein
MLGELLYPMVKELAKDKALAPKITGILLLLFIILFL